MTEVKNRFFSYSAFLIFLVSFSTLSSAQVKVSERLGNSQPVSADYFEISKNLDVFNSIYRELNIYYVDGTRPGLLMKTGIDAMLNSLDPYTVYYPENDIEEYRLMTTGNYDGLGFSLNAINGKIIITDMHEGFAAHKAGIRTGDQLIGVNNSSVEGKKMDEVIPLLKGTAGTSVKIRILKAGSTVPQEYNLVREEIKNSAVPYYGVLGNSSTGYIKLSSFTDNCSNEVKDALLNLKSKGCKSLVLDLRDNLGGLMHEAVNIVSFFIDKGQEVVFTRGKVADWDKTYLSTQTPLDTQIPLVVLVNESSASASEIVSGALQDLDRAVVIGKRTYGKGLVQQTKDLVYNSKVKITVAKYYIPSGRCVQALDYRNKDEDGRVEKVPDSLITAFKTKGGRIVYDGAGINPDIRTAEEKNSQVLVALMSRYHIFNYATQYYLAHPSIPSPEEFELSEAEFAAFIAYLADKDYSYKTASEVELEELKRNAEREKYFSDIKQEYEALAAKMKANKKDDITKHRAEIKRYLEEEIISRYYFQKGRLRYLLRGDVDIEECLKLLKEDGRMKTILTTIDKPLKPFNVKKRF